MVPIRGSVDAVVCVRHQVGRLDVCLEALRAHLPPEATITIADAPPGPPKEGDQRHGEVARLAREAKAHVMLNGRGQWECRNRAAAQGYAPILLFLDGDCALETGAWPALTATLEREQVGVVGGLLLWEEGLAPREAPLARCVKLAGYAFGVRRLPYARFVGWLPDNPKLYARDDLQAVGANFMATRRPLWRSLQGFAPDYGGRPFADIDYCLRARNQGVRVAFEPEAVALAGGEPLSDSFAALREGAGMLTARLGPLAQFDEFLML
ncbi:MAG: hypothetical protein A2V88_08900 [Elusimicrobia bacterium RBG_16_66_12]|nr:MAG: hypothetical protein A2V88_08900 [Elusimicrobia bacterium RBG_16_66_12]